MRVIHTNLTYFCKNVSVYSCEMSAHADRPPPKTLISHGARDSVHTSTSPDEISFWVQPTRPSDTHATPNYAGCTFTCHIMGSCERYGGNWVQVCVRAFEEAAAALDLSFSLRDGSCFAQTAERALTFTRAKPVADWWFFLFLVYVIGAPHDVGRHDVSKPVLSPDTPPIFRSEVTAESCVEANHKKW